MHAGHRKHKFKFNSHLYQKMKEKLAHAMSLNNPSKNPEVRAKISRTLTGRKLSAKHKDKISAGLYTAMTSEVRAKMSASHKGKKLSRKHRANISKSKMGENNPSYHKHWFNDGTHNVFSHECPEGFTAGRIISKCPT